MKILALMPMSNGIYKDDTTMLCDGLEKYHGCEVIRLACEPGGIRISSNHKKEDVFSVDVIWAPYEPLIAIGLELKRQIGKPLVGHYEVVPTNRVRFDEIEKHFIETNEELPEAEHTLQYKRYKQYVEDWIRCDVRTTTEQSTFDKIELLNGFPIPPGKGRTRIKPYPLDTEMLDKYKITNPETKRQIVSVMRLVDHKKHHHVLKALSMMENPPKYVIVGSGPNYAKLVKMAEELKLDVEFTGVVTDSEKAKIIQESMFCVHPWAWLPVGEAAYYGKGSIAYYQQDTYNRLNNVPIYCRANDIPMLSILIKSMCEKEKDTKEFGERAREILLSGGCKTYPIETASGKMLEILKEAIE